MAEAVAAAAAASATARLSVPGHTGAVCRLWSRRPTFYAGPSLARAAEAEIEHRLTLSAAAADGAGEAVAARGPAVALARAGGQAEEGPRRR